MRRFTTILGLLLTTVLLAATCAGSSEDDASGDFTEAAGEPRTEGEGGDVGDENLQAPAATLEESMADTGGDAEFGSADLNAAGVAPSPEEPSLVAVPQQVLDGRSIIFTSTMSVAVEDVAVATAEAQALIDPLGGLLFGQEATGGDEPRAILTFKVPPDKFQDALFRLGGLGEVISQTRTTDDVTEAVVDLQSRIRTAETSVERLRGLMADATNLDNIATLEAQLLERETTLEQLRGQLRTLEGQVDLATIVMTLSQADLVSSGITLTATAIEGHDTGDTCRGREGIQLEDGAAVTFCYSVTNSGVTELSDVVIIDEALDLTTEDLALVSGEPGTLAAGESVVYRYETTVDGDLTSQAEVRALTNNGDEVGSVDSVRVSALGGDGLPGFGDAVSASLDALQTAGGFLLIAAGVLLPFLVILVPAYLLFRWFRRSRRPAPPAPPSPEGPADDTTPPPAPQPDPEPEPEPSPEPELVG